MKKFIYSLLLLVLLLVCYHASHARDFYYSDCGTGSYGSCANGTDGTAGGSCTVGTPCRTSGNLQTNFNSAAAGDRFYLARGGVWLNAALTLQNLNATVTNPVSIDSYIPSWCTSTCPASYPRPILKAESDGTVFTFTNGGAGVADGGYNITGLKLEGNGTATGTGLFANKDASTIVLDNLHVSGFAAGINGGDDFRKFVIRNSTVTGNHYQGIFTGTKDVLIEYNVVDDNARLDSPGYGHNIYIAGDHTQNITIRGNTVTNNSNTDGLGTCTSVSIVVHGQHDGLVIEGNTVKELTSSIGDGCWGIAVDNSGDEVTQIFRNVRIRNNRIINFAIGVACNSCIAPIIENNVITYEGANQFYGIKIPDRGIFTTSQAWTVQSTGSIIRNNTIVANSCNSDCVGIFLGTDSGQTSGSNQVVANNLIFFASAANQFHRCFDTDGVTISNFTKFDNNICYHQAGNGRWSNDYANLAAAQAVGFDLNSLSTNPAFVAVPNYSNNGSAAVQTGSPAINAGHTTYKASKGFQGSAAVGARDIGAYEYGSTP